MSDVLNLKNMDAEYLRVHLADCLTHSLVELSLKRPHDPIGFLAQIIIDWKAQEVIKILI